MFIVNFLASPFGRLNRASWWLVQLISLFLVIATVVLALALLMADPDATLAAQEAGQANLPLMINLAFLPAMWVCFCAGVKRCHDRGKTGFWYLIAFVPFVGQIWQLIELGFLPGEYGGNDYGRQPAGGVGMSSPSPAKQSKPAPVWSRAASDPAPRAMANDRSTAPRETFGLRGA